jgi:hypothetical protein
LFKYCALLLLVATPCSAFDRRGQQLDKYDGQPETLRDAEEQVTAQPNRSTMKVPFYPRDYLRRPRGSVQVELSKDD